MRCDVRLSTAPSNEHAEENAWEASSRCRCELSSTACPNQRKFYFENPREWCVHWLHPLQRYLPMQRDLLQSALKLSFYDLFIKPGENYAQFIARFDTSLRKLKEQQIELPEIVKGFMFIKKLRLDSAQESRVLTATSGSLKCSKVITAVRSIFPEGKGPSKSSRSS